MPTLEWDKVGERIFEAGIRKGVLYIQGECGVPWNGLTSVDEDPIMAMDPLMFDGVKYGDVVSIGNFSGVLKAFTYPDEFLQCLGVLEDESGFNITAQPIRTFGLSYQTTMGDDLNGSESCYKIHLLYNLKAVPASTSYVTLSDSLEPTEFEWDLTSIPEQVSGFRPTAHVIIDSRKIDPYLLSDIEDILYGEPEGHDLRIVDNGDGTWTASTDQPGVITMIDDTTFSIIADNARYLNSTTYRISGADKCAHLPALNALIEFTRSWQRLIITDHHNGTWSAYSTVPGLITMLSPTKFQIVSDTAEYLDVDTYTISSSNKEDNDIWLDPF